LQLVAGAARHHASHGPDCIYARPAHARRVGRLLASRVPVVRPAWLGRLGGDRRVGPAVVGALILATSLFAALPAASASVGGTGQAANPAIADLRAAELGASTTTAPEPAASAPATATTARLAALDDSSAAGPYATDGTLLTTPTVVSPSPGVEVRVYAVTAGDTLTGIAARFGLSMMTLWWSNTLASKDQLHVGELLLIPPTDGVLYTAQAGDTVVAVATRFRADPAAMRSYNHLATDELTLGQQVMIPNGVGPSIVLATAAKPTVAPTSHPASHVTVPRATSTSGCTGCGFAPLLWPVKGGYVSQGFGCTGFSAEPPFGSCPHYHGGIDIAAPTGTPIVAAAAGTVIFAGWKSNGGGYQVWVSDGHDFYTGYHHMSAVLVHTGQHIGRGQLIGRVGMTGDATGPHCHFEVWIGPIWNGGVRVNPLAYF